MAQIEIQTIKKFGEIQLTNFSPKRCFAPIEIETMKNFVNKEIIFGPYYGVSFRDLYSEYNKFAKEFKAKKNLASKDLQKQKFWALLQIALLETGRKEDILNLSRKQKKVFI